MNKIFLSLLILVALFFSQKTFAQNEHNMGNMQMKKDTVPQKKMNNMGNMQMKKDTMPKQMQMGKKMNMQRMGMMSSSFSRNLSMNRNGSGTSWLPDASPVYGHMIMNESSMFMLHGNIFLRYTNQDIFNKGSR